MTIIAIIGPVVVVVVEAATHPKILERTQHTLRQ
jgi:hypothetical protein